MTDDFGEFYHAEARRRREVEAQGQRGRGGSGDCSPVSGGFVIESWPGFCA